MALVHTARVTQRYPHLLSLLVVVAAFAAVLTIGNALSSQFEDRYIYALTPLRFQEKYSGVVLQRQAFQHPDLLPFYGSSEVDLPDTYQLRKIFRWYPTGFNAFMIGGDGAGPMIYLQRLAGVGSGLSGKKVVISLSPQLFIQNNPIGAYGYNRSRLGAYETIFSTALSLSLKHRIAHQMLYYGEGDSNDQFLLSTLRLLADGSPRSIALYYAALPLGRFAVQLLELGDHWTTVNWIRAQPDLDPTVTRRLNPIDWTAMIGRGERTYKEHANNNPFVFDNDLWAKSGEDWLEKKDSMSDGTFLKILKQSPQWTDLDLLLQELDELGANPMILSMPWPGTFMDYVGVSATARQVYYDRLEETVKPYGIPVVDFREYDVDPYFLIDPNGHLSSKGWLVYAQTIDAFYQDRLDGLARVR